MKQKLISILFFTTIFTTFFAQEKEVEKLIKVFSLIETKYVDSLEISDVVEEAIQGMLGSLDPHSVYIPKEEVEEKTQSLRGNFEGIGIRYYMIGDTLTISEVIPTGPCEKAGVKNGDKIIKIEDSLVAGVKLNSDEYRTLLMGPKGSEVKLYLQRNGESKLLKYKIKRGKIPIRSVVSSYILEDSIGYIKLRTFAATTNTELNKAFESLEKEGLRDLILDLRDNGGGYLNQAEKLLSRFLDAGKVMVFTKGVSGESNYAYAKQSSNKFSGRLIVLVNQNSASASEIFSGAIQDWDRGLIVGRRTFGKGLVQRQYKLNDGSMLRLTIARYYTPSGRSIQKEYEKGNQEAYKEEKYDRIESGELFHLDSVKVDSTKSYNTQVNHRLVYGGGGILPDCFLPLDTIGTSDLYRDISRKALVPKFVLEEFVISQRGIFKESYPNYDSFSNFIVDEDLLEMFKRYVEKADVEWKEEDYQVSKEWIDQSLRSNLANQFYGSSYYYTEFNKYSKDVLKGVELLKNSEYASFELTNN